MADSSENILVEFDYNNIAVIDPNKIIDEDGKAKQRLVKHEDLVMYANLECKVLPRTKLLLGVSNADTLRTISVSSMNFLNPGQKTFLDNAYTDELTGKDTLKGEGVNQQQLRRVSSPNKSNEWYYFQQTKSGKDIKATDNGLLGIKSISIKTGLDFMPVVNIKLEDVKGRALFESGNDSPYSAFFNLPYPLFYLTVKGYYGKAVRMPLMLQDFVSSYNTGTGNFDIDLTLYTYKFTVISEVSHASLVAVPHMYRSNIQVTPKNIINGLLPNSSQPKVQTENTFVELGFEKIKEVYSEYKAKGLISKDFPEITMVQMVKRLQKFIDNLMDSYSKEDMNPLTDVSEYIANLNEFKTEIYYGTESWFSKYMDTQTYYILKTDKQRIYTFSKQFKGSELSIKNELSKLITQYNTELDNNKTCGINGSYKIAGKEVPCQIKSKVEYTIFQAPEPIEEEDIDFEETAKARGLQTSEVNNLKIEFQKLNLTQASTVELIDGSPVPVFTYFKFDGINSFVDITEKMSKEAQSKLDEIEAALTDALANLIQTNNPVLGFIPTIRNVLAVVFASGEAFLRLLEDVHTKAWEKRDSPYRKGPIFNVKTSGANPDALLQGENAKAYVYPWPEFLIQTTGENGEEKFQPKYPGDTDVINTTKAFLFDFWPEVEFVEEYLRALTVKQEEINPLPTANELTDSRRLSLNAIEFPTTNNVFNNKEEVKFFFEIYERLILTSFYSRMNRTATNGFELQNISQATSEAESINIIQSLAATSPSLQEKLTNYGYNSSNFLSVLKQFSNQGVGESWQNFKRGIFNTSYIKNLVQNDSFKITNLSSSVSILNENVSTSNVSPTVSSEDESKVSEYISASTQSKKFEFTDTYPFIDKDWCRNNLAGDNPISPYLVNFINIPTPNISLADFFDTTKNLFYNITFKTIANFSGATLVNSGVNDYPKPFSSYNFRRIKMPSTAPQNAVKTFLNLNDLRQFYTDRNTNYSAQLPTEGSLNYKNKNGLLPNYQTISILNTPYFVNSIQESIQKFRDFDPYPYTAPAYLFLNSLPLSTLREKYTKFTAIIPQNSTQEQINVEYMNYVFATLKKYGAIHRLPLPWVLKIGSIWHRYKKWVETGIDILDNSWKSFDYLGNFDPITSAATTDYALTIQNNQNVDIILEKNSVIGTQDYSQMNTGFYPQTLNDFNVFYQGFRLFTGFTNSDVQSGLTTYGVNLINCPTANVTIPFNGDPSNSNRFIQINSWSVYVESLDKQSCYILPSHGAVINQVADECVENGLKKIEVTGNTSVFNGSVRTFWNAPTYGYFDVNDIVKPTPDEYMKKVFGGFAFQENFSINGNLSGYTKISELFSVFEKKILDDFETKFLNFCVPKYNYVDFDVNATDSVRDFGNFQMLMTRLMKVSKPTTGLTPTQIINYFQEQQILTFSNFLTAFMDYDVLVKYGNPSNYDKKLFYTFSTKEIFDGYIFEKYSVVTPGALPTSANTQTLVASKLQYPEAWEALLTYVGFSEIDGIRYSDSGSTIFDFFIDFDISFDKKNIEICSPIIKMYVTEKLKTPATNTQLFIKSMDDYIDRGTFFINRTLDSLFTKVRKNIQRIKIVKESKIDSVTNGSQIKLEVYENFKATNDKWIAGMDFKNKTLFEDVLLLDRASKNIGDTVVCDIFEVIKILDTTNTKTNMMYLVDAILTANNFQYMYIPSYVNFYNVQEVAKNAAPKPEGSLELANTLFGTFTNVDYRNSSTKMVCFYAGKPSVHLDTAGIIEGFKNDSFDLRRIGDSPLIENQVNKRDFGLSNKVVGFNVDIGPQNQGVFSTFSVSQKNSTPTAEGLQLISKMAAQASNRAVATQNLSLYNVYKLRSYDCNVTMLGNALIQPMMYFNLRNVPMFTGAYLITEVSHSIQSGNFVTTFSGVRQPMAGYQTNLTFLQSLKTNLVQKIIDKKKENYANERAIGNNSIANKDKIITSNLSAAENANETQCLPIQKYQKDYTKLDGQPNKTAATVSDAKKYILSIGQSLNIPTQALDKLKYAVFAQMYLQGGNTSTFVGYEQNYIGASLDGNWANLESNFSSVKKYFCISKNQVKFPYVVFDSLESNIELLLSKWKFRSANIKSVTAENIAAFVTVNSQPNNLSVSNYTSLPQEDRKKIEDKVQESITLYDSII